MKAHAIALSALVLLAVYIVLTLAHPLAVIASTGR